MKAVLIAATVACALSGCAGHRTHGDGRFGTSENLKTQETAARDMAAEQAKAVAQATATAATTVAAAAPAPDHAAAPAKNEHKEIHPGVPAATALRWLMNGNTRYTKSAWRKDGASKKDIERLSTGQHPHAIVVSCSDSRVPPELVFDQKLGEIFTVRTAGQSLDHNSIGSIEYAVEHLGARLVVVMGHTACGAVKAAFETMGGASAGTASLDALVHDIHPRLAAFKGQTPSTAFEKESWANADGVATDLISRSKLLAEKWNAGHIMVVPALYNLKTGQVSYHEALKADAPRTPASQH